MTELALSVEHLQNQNTEKDQVNRTLSDKLEALVSWTPAKSMARLLGPC